MSDNKSAKKSASKRAKKQLPMLANGRLRLLLTGAIAVLVAVLLPGWIGLPTRIPSLGHGVLSFFFNTMILAMSINVIAGLIQNKGG